MDEKTLQIYGKIFISKIFSKKNNEKFWNVENLIISQRIPYHIAFREQRYRQEQNCRYGKRQYYGALS